MGSLHQKTHLGKAKRSKGRELSRREMLADQVDYCGRRLNALRWLIESHDRELAKLDAKIADLQEQRANMIRHYEAAPANAQAILEQRRKLQQELMTASDVNVQKYARMVKKLQETREAIDFDAMSPEEAELVRKSLDSISPEL